MEIYVVQPGDNLFGIAQAFGVPMSQIMEDNRLPNPSLLVVGQTLVIRFPEEVYTVQPGDTLVSVALQSGLSLRQLYRNNPILEGQPTLYPGQTLVLRYQGSPGPSVTVNSYAYPFINQSLLQRTLPFLTYLTPFTYGIQEDGELVSLDDEPLIAMGRAVGTAALMHLSTLTESGNFSNDLANLVLNDLSLQEVLIDNVLTTLQTKGYSGLDVDFEFVFPQDALPYAAFIRRLRDRLNPVFLMTYEWGYTYGPPMAVAPLPNVRAVVEYALTEIPAEKLWLGVPNYGYDWPLPFLQGETRATSISPQYAVSLAARYRSSISYDETAQAPWFRYTDENGTEHEVWFEDARSIRAKLSLIPEYGLDGAGYWNLMRPFPQNWLVLDSLFTIRETPLPAGLLRS